MEHFTLPITSLYASLCGLLIIVLAIQVVKLRRRLKVGIGAGIQEDRSLERAIRVHANAVEYIPIALLLLAFYELNGGNTVLLHAMGMVLVIARGLHAQGLSGSHGTSFGRFWGTALTWLVIVIISLANLFEYFRGWF